MKAIGRKEGVLPQKATTCVALTDPNQLQVMPLGHTQLGLIQGQ